MFNVNCSTSIINKGGSREKKTLKHLRLFNYIQNPAIQKRNKLENIQKLQFILLLISGTVEAAIEFLNKGKYLRRSSLAVTICVHISVCLRIYIL